MQSQNLYPIPHSVTHNTLKVTTGAKDKEVDIESYKSTKELDYIDSLSSNSINNNIILMNGSDPLIDEFLEKNHVLQAQWKIKQQQIDHLKKDNEKLQKLLKEERVRTAKYQKKLHFIQDNQPVFEKLKQAYISLKYNEQKDKSSLIEVQEIGCQTILLCQDIAQETPTKDNSPRSNFSLSQTVKVDLQSDFSLSRSIDEDNEVTFEVEPGFMPIRKQHYNEMKKTVQKLKSLIISQPLSTFVISEKKEAKYRKDIADMFLENRTLKQLVVDQQLELDANREQLSLRNTSKEGNVLKRIIAKVGRQIRSCKTCNSKINIEALFLNETEQKIVKHICSKYELKYQLKKGESYMEETPKTPRLLNAKTPRSTSKSPRSTLKTPRSGTPYYTPRYEELEQALDTYRSCDDISSDSV